MISYNNQSDLVSSPAGQCLIAQLNQSNFRRDPATCVYEKVMYGNSEESSAERSIREKESLVTRRLNSFQNEESDCESDSDCVGWQEGMSTMGPTYTFKEAWTP
ncbi:MAG: hypothetical protein JSS09_05545, partial [Verrucomicrobia bacterium]|nr:hypothetical protein [Verrucomicrobiota bacterium]